MTTPPEDHELLDAPLALLLEAQEQIAALIAQGFTGYADDKRDLAGIKAYLDDVVADANHVAVRMNDRVEARTPIATAHDARRKDAMAMGDAL